MINRRDTLRVALTARSRELPTGNSADENGSSKLLPISTSAIIEAEAPRPLVRSGAVGAMGRSLGRIAHAADEARALMAAGDTVVELDPFLVDPSFIADRLASGADEPSDLVELIRNHGQQVPILVRPHPDHQTRYQIAYGHRRLRAAIALGRPIRAVIKALSDADLVVAQGQENSARTDLSYIERALFAVSLEARGFDRATVMAALAMEKTQLSRLIAIGRAIPAALVIAIGPAPKTGRPRWSALVEALSRSDADTVLEATLNRQDFRTLDSDARFGRVLMALSAAPHPERGSLISAWKNPIGQAVVRIDQNARRTHLTVDERIEPRFGAFLIENLPDLYQAFQACKMKGEAS